MIKVSVMLEEREDGGLQIYCDEIPGLCLSGSDPIKVTSDLWPAIQMLLKHRMTTFHVPIYNGKGFA